MARGGYRKPANPAPVSGPGALSRRTDGRQPVMNMPGGAYGEGKALREIQSSAPMAQQQVQPQQPMPQVTGLFEPTQRPQEPITEGMPFGAGNNSLPLKQEYVRPNLRQTLLKAMQNSDDPDLEHIYNQLASRGDI